MCDSSSVDVDTPLPYPTKNKIFPSSETFLTLSNGTAGKEEFQILSVMTLRDLKNVYIMTGNLLLNPVGYGISTSKYPIVPVEGLILRLDLRPMVPNRVMLFIPKLTKGFTTITWTGYKKNLDHINNTALDTLIKHYEDALSVNSKANMENNIEKSDSDGI